MNKKLQVYESGGSLFAQTKTEYVLAPDGSTEEYRYLYAPQVDAIRQTRFDCDFAAGFGEVVNILFFSDIHGDGTNLARIVDFWKSLPFPIDCFFGGDMVQYANGSNARKFWTNIEGTENIMVTIGNHDSQGSSAASSYDDFIAPFVENWGVTYSQDLCYYYKDYTERKLRLIVLDCMHWDASQQSWLISTLSSAKTAGYHVICASHYTAGSGADRMDCSFDTIGTGQSYFSAKINAEAPEAVQDFIDGGGHFVCWLAGHMHADVFREMTSYPKQLMIMVANASMVAHVSTAGVCQLERVDGTRSQDLFDVVTIDTYHSLLMLTRVGADHDNYGRHIGAVLYDYANNRLLWND